MKRTGKSVSIILILVILAFAYTSFFGISSQLGARTDTYIKGAGDIRFGIDIRGGVDVTFAPADDADATDKQMDQATAVIKQRLIGQNITDYEVYTDYNKDRIIARFPWKSDEKDYDPQKAIDELGKTALLTFREGKEQDSETGEPTGVTASNIILSGTDVTSASVTLDENNQPVVSLELDSEGTSKFADATGKLYTSKGTISIWLDNDMISYPTVNAHITDGKAIISGGFTSKEASNLANLINSGALPFKLTTDGFSSINPTLGQNALNSMVLAGVIAFVLICIFMILMYRIPGVVACVTLIGQVAGALAAISGYLPFINSFTLTLPGIAGIILSIGMGVDANIISFERIKDELRAGKTLDSSIAAGYANSASAIIDGNITTMIVAIILMGVFGPTTSLFGRLLSPFLFMFGPSTTGSIYSFGYTLLVGVIMNFIMAVLFSKFILKSLARFKPLRNKKLYGGVEK